jgi:hypothetical protein
LTFLHCAVTPRQHHERETADPPQAAVLFQLEPLCLSAGLVLRYHAGFEKL